ncbi:MAG: hypothetical protein A2W20_02255 [Candidatus Aminicenantes bacterium RBG_16_66_30]|nr:MAG: hypothetical protein A2W20_02255 [Candidatus Aminicenantes bacterium RBG_16_66_30]
MASTDDPLIVQRQGRVCTFVINRPDKLNSVTPEIMVRLGDGLSALKEDDEVRAVVLRGAGTSAFSAGFDIARIGGLPQEAGLAGNPLRLGSTSAHLSVSWRHAAHILGARTLVVKRLPKTAADVRTERGLSGTRLSSL